MLLPLLHDCLQESYKKLKGKIGATAMFFCGTKQSRTRPCLYLAIYSGCRINNLALLSLGGLGFNTMMRKWLLLGPKVVFFYIGGFGLSLMWFLSMDVPLKDSLRGKTCVVVFLSSVHLNTFLL